MPAGAGSPPPAGLPLGADNESTQSDGKDQTLEHTAVSANCTHALPAGDRQRRAGRLPDVIGLLARLILGVVLIWAGAAKVTHPAKSALAVRCLLYTSDAADDL